MKPDLVTIGTRFYHVDADGLIRQLAVIRLPFADDAANFWDVSDAVATAVSRIEVQLQAGIDSRVKEQKLTERLQMLREGLVKFTDKAEPFLDRNDFGSFARSRDEPKTIDLSKLPSMDNVVQPGTTIWLPVTPRTHHSVIPGFRPESFFVLETTVVSAEWLLRMGYVWYQLDSHYSISDYADLCLSREAAKLRLCEYIERMVPAKAVPERIKVYSSADEKVFHQGVSDELAKRYEKGMALLADY